MKSLRTKLCVSIFFLQFLSGCEIAGARPVVPTDQSSTLGVFNYVQVEQWAISLTQIANALSNLQGYTMVATKESTFEKWKNPASTCMFTANDSVSVTPKYRLDIGAISLSGTGMETKELSKDPETLIFSRSGSLSPGIFSLSGAGNSRGSFVFSQNFTVPEAGSMIKITNGSDAAQELPSPNVVSDSDPRFNATINKANTVRLEYQAPEGVDYVRTTIMDNSNSGGGSVTCYSPPFTPTEIPAGALRYFRSTQDAALFVDFVSVSQKTDIEDIKESLVLSYVRHVHGLQEYLIDGQNVTVRYGKLIIE